MKGNNQTASGSGFGSVFQVWPAQTPDLEAVPTPDGVKVNIAGDAGARYEVFRSADLANWTLQGVFNMPSSGNYSFWDAAAQTNHAYYRAAWVP